jgi:hypothetical protein
MRDNKDIIIEKLCNFINYLEDTGCLTEDDSETYRQIMQEYTTGYGSHSHEGYTSYIAYSILDVDNVRRLEYIPYGDEPESIAQLFRHAAEMICFADCSDEIVESIVVRGHKAEYVGWQPNMLFEFRLQETGETAFCGCFPQWDH